MSSPTDDNSCFLVDVFEGKLSEIYFRLGLLVAPNRSQWLLFLFLMSLSVVVDVVFGQ